MGLRRVCTRKCIFFQFMQRINGEHGPVFLYIHSHCDGGKTSRDARSRSNWRDSALSDTFSAGCLHFYSSRKRTAAGDPARVFSNAKSGITHAVYVNLLAVRKIGNTILLTLKFAALNSASNFQLTCDAQIHLWRMVNLLTESFWNIQKLEPHILYFQHTCTQQKQTC